MMVGMAATRAKRAPTARQRRIGVELKRMREGAGLSIAEGASLLGTDRTTISNMEAGRFGVNEDRIRQLAANYDCADETYIDALAAAAETKTRGWWDEYRGVLPSGLIDVAEMEFHAVRLTVTESLHIPGLLQTEEHARALLRLDLPPPSEVDVQRRLSHRMKRRVIFERDEPTPCRFYVHEAALLMRLTGFDVQQRQLDRVLEMTEQAHISVHVIPFTAERYAGAGSAMTYASAPSPQLDTVELESPHGCVFMDAPSPLAKYRSMLDRMSSVALSSHESRDFIRATRERL